MDNDLKRMIIAKTREIGLGSDDARSDEKYKFKILEILGYLGNTMRHIHKRSG